MCVGGLAHDHYQASIGCRQCRWEGAGGGEVYVAEVMATFVRYFVAFLFLEGLYLRPDTGATNMRDEIGRRVFRFRPRYALRFALMRALPALFETNISRATFISAIICVEGRVIRNTVLTVPWTASNDNELIADLRSTCVPPVSHRNFF